jgi:hypothetical protein
MYFMFQGGEEPTTSSDEVVTERTTREKVPATEDTGEAIPQEAIKAVPTRKPRATSRSSKQQANRPAPPKRGSITVKIGAGDPYSKLEVKCPRSGIRQQANFSGGTASVGGIPSEDCTLFFKGPGASPKFGPVRPGRTLSCTFIGTTASCR